MNKNFLEEFKGILNPIPAMRKVIKNKTDDIFAVAEGLYMNGKSADEFVDEFKRLGVDGPLEYAKKYAGIKDMDAHMTKYPTEEKSRMALAKNVMDSVNTIYPKTSPGIVDNAKTLAKNTGIKGIGSAVKDYYTGGTIKENLIRGAVTYGALNVVGTAGRLATGGTLTRDRNGNKDIAGVPFF